MSERHTLTESVDQALIGMVADNRLPAEDYHKVHDILTGKVIVYDNTFEGRLNSALSEFGYKTARKIGYIIEDANGRDVDFRNGCMGVTDKIYAKEPRNIRHLGYTRNATAWLFNVESGF